MTPDRRLTLARPDLADAALEGVVAAARYVVPARRRVRAPLVDLRPEPRLDAGIDTQALMGEAVDVLDVDEEGFAFARLVRDGYVGYLSADALGEAEPAPTHRVAAIRTFLYPGPSMKLPIAGWLSMGAAIPIEETRGDFGHAPGAGWLYLPHLAQQDAAPEPDFVAVAERFLHTPYLWGGISSLGLDCSGLVRTALHGAGRACPRDTDMQERALGEALPEGAALARGDLVFWKGHVGIMRDGETLLHANGHHMAVASEPLADARSRILEKSFGPVTSIRRLA
ncbi:C40 family peptidase [Salinarimonas ramus]|uniref:Peptidase P60 n=1 Tax=Salinarimonas ramus TaxID=690164 RepID=A0A917V210_9HYPH|nr:NlpC/P60 family protein [Salinarimonas ramus]GGK19993.1 peptidase P60 [Salinarimonas ramus]